MAIEYFHIRESDFDVLDQLIELEESIHTTRGAGLNAFELHTFIRYGRVYAATEYDEVLGCCYFMKAFDNPGKVFLYGISVRPYESGKNIGVNLLKSAMLDLRDSNLRMVEVTVHPANQKALRIYREQLGFHIINAADDSSYDEEDYLILRRNL